MYKINSILIFFFSTFSLIGMREIKKINATISNAITHYNLLQGTRNKRLFSPWEFKNWAEQFFKVSEEEQIKIKSQLPDLWTIKTEYKKKWETIYNQPCTAIKNLILEEKEILKSMNLGWFDSAKIPFFLIVSSSKIESSLSSLYIPSDKDLYQYAQKAAVAHYEIPLIVEKTSTLSTAQIDGLNIKMYVNPNNKKYELERFILAHEHAHLAWKDFLTLTVTYLNAINTLKEKRIAHIAEERADRTAAQLLGKKPIEAFIKRLYERNLEESATHPSSKARIKYLEQIYNNL